MESRITIKKMNPVAGATTTRNTYVLQRTDGLYVGFFGWSLTWEKSVSGAFTRHYDTRAQAHEARRRILRGKR